jgi:putative acetyltransferase
MQVRRYEIGEEEELWNLCRDTTRIITGEVYTKEQIDRWAPHDKNMDEWKERIEKRNPFVAIQDGKIVGFAELEADGHIDYSYAHHQWQGKGVGSALYSAIENEAISKKMSRLYAEVSVPAKEFFLRQGFEVVEEQNNIVCGAPAPNFRMEKKLTSS